MLLQCFSSLLHLLPLLLQLLIKRSCTSCSLCQHGKLLIVANISFAKSFQRPCRSPNASFWHSFSQILIVAGQVHQVFLERLPPLQKVSPLVRSGSCGIYKLLTLLHGLFPVSFERLQSTFILKKTSEFQGSRCSRLRLGSLLQFLALLLQFLLKSSLSPCSLCQGSFTLSIRAQDLGSSICSQGCLCLLHCCTGICHKLLPLAFKRVTSCFPLFTSARILQCLQFGQLPGCLRLHFRQVAGLFHQVSSSQQRLVGRAWLPVKPDPLIVQLILKGTRTAS
mmetsp:Transcript_22029/g.48402  ORF Transcript_22029/g.48402 Transcript_22029/m.48402 type:complete len:280 (+) Transcript_22029:3161-4000(+)